MAPASSSRSSSCTLIRHHRDFDDWLKRSEDFGGYLRLTDEELTEEFVQSIQQRATKRFFNGDDQSCLYFKAGVRKRIEQTFSEAFVSPQPSVDTSLYDSLGLRTPTISTMFPTDQWAPVEGGRDRAGIGSKPSPVNGRAGRCAPANWPDGSDGDTVRCIVSGALPSRA